MFSKKSPPKLCVAALILMTGLVRGDDRVDKAWEEVPAILERIVAPTFPDRVFSVTDFGAMEGGRANCGDAFKRAIEACHEAGGGRVLVPAGRFLTGPVHLKSGVELHLAEGSELVFSDRFEDYLPPVLVRVGGIECYNYSPLIYARDCENVAVTGKGKLDGNSGSWWEWKGKETREHFRMGTEGVPVEKRVFAEPKYGIRPSFLCLFECRNVLLEDFTIGSGPNWTIHPVYCTNVTIRGVTVDTDGPNNDGIDPDSCRDVLIEHCTFSTGDDCVVLKSGYNEDGWRVGRPTENVIMRHCSSAHGHGGLVIGSEMSGGVRNVFMHDCHFEGTDRAIRIKSRLDRGGVVERVFARDLTVKDMVHEAVILNMDYGADPNRTEKVAPPVFRDMTFERLSGRGAPLAVLIRGSEASPVSDIRFRGIQLKTTGGVDAAHVQNLLFEDVDVRPSKGPAFLFSHAKGVVLRAVGVPDGAAPLVRVESSAAGAVTVEDTVVTRARLELGEGVPEGAIKID